MKTDSGLGSEQESGAFIEITIVSLLLLPSCFFWWKMPAYLFSLKNIKLYLPFS
jgi:hypothetical protein